MQRAQARQGKTSEAAKQTSLLSSGAEAAALDSGALALRAWRSLAAVSPLAMRARTGRGVLPVSRIGPTRILGFVLSLSTEADASGLKQEGNIAVLLATRPHGLLATFRHAGCVILCRAQHWAPW